MDRAHQRELAVALANADRAREENRSTLPFTVHFDEILMEHLAIAGIELLKDYPAETRRRMAKEGRAMPNGGYPIADCADAADAIRAVGRAKPSEREAVKAFIRRRVRALGCEGSIYDNWK